MKLGGGLLTVAALACAWAWTLPNAANADPRADRVMVLLKFVPEAGRPADPAIRFDPASCAACVQLHDPAYERFNTRETVLQFEVPRQRVLELAFETGANPPRRVILNDADLSARKEGRRLIVELPPLAEDAPWAPALETDIVEPGMILRVEPADLARRAGEYAQGRFPALERRAADNLSFAQREVIRRLGLGADVERDKVGVIMLMGFDTNYPAGHADGPPHIHMHLRWPNNVGTQIGHYYINDKGLLTENTVGVRALGAPQRRFGRGETFATIDNRGRAVYAHTITLEGWLRIDRPSGGSCMLKPSGSGFQDGVSLDCGALGSTTIQVTNDLAAGVITVHTGDIVERFRYDIDTGTLLTSMAAPPAPASARNPEY